MLLRALKPWRGRRLPEAQLRDQSELARVPWTSRTCLPRGLATRDLATRRESVRRRWRSRCPEPQSRSLVLCRSALVCAQLAAQLPYVKLDRAWRRSTRSAESQRPNLKSESRNSRQPYDFRVQQSLLTGKRKAARRCWTCRPLPADRRLGLTNLRAFTFAWSVFTLQKVDL